MKLKHQRARKYFSNLRRSNLKAKAAFVCRSNITQLTRLKTLTGVYVRFAKIARDELIIQKSELKMAHVTSDESNSDVNKPPISKVSSVSEVVGNALDHDIVMSKIRQFIRKFSRFKNVDKLLDNQDEFNRAKQSWEIFCKVCKR